MRAVYQRAAGFPPRSSSHYNERAMSDTISLSLWYPQLRMEALEEKLHQILAQFAAHGGEPGVFSVTVWPVNWREAASFQEIYGAGEHAARIDHAVAQALELFHPDDACEFQIGWNLWEPNGGLDPASPDADEDWVRRRRLVRVIAYGPEFDEGSWTQDGHVRIDFGSDEAFLQEEIDLNELALSRIEENIRQLIALVESLQKETEPSSRLLWSELGESLAARLQQRLNRVH